MQSTAMRKMESEDSDVQGAPSTMGSDTGAETVAAAAAAIGATDSDGNSEDDDLPDSSTTGSLSSEERGSLTLQDRIDDCLAVRTHCAAQPTQARARHLRPLYSCGEPLTLRE